MVAKDCQGEKSTLSIDWETEEEEDEQRTVT